MKTKKCICCGEVKDINRFKPNKKGKLIYYASCSTCRKIVSHRIANRKYKEKNKVALYKKTCLSKNRESAKLRSKKYYTDNKEKVSELSKVYREKNKEIIRERSVKYYQANKSIYIIKAKKYR